MEATQLVNILFPPDGVIPPPHQKSGLFNIIGVLRFIDSAVIGTFNKLMEDTGAPDRKIEMMPYKSDRIEELTGEIQDDGSAKRIITYRIRRSEPGLLSGGTRDLKFRHRDTVQDLSKMNDLGTPVATDILGKWIDYTVRFDCFAPTWKESQTLVLEFEDILDVCAAFITANTGVVKFIQNGRSSDVYHMKTAYFYEPLTVLIRIEKQKYESSEALAQFETLLGDRLMQISTAE